MMRTMDQRDGCDGLKNTAMHAILNITLLLLLLVSIIFKLHRVVTRRSYSSLSMWYVFLGALVNISQNGIVILGSMMVSGAIICHPFVDSLGLGALSPLLLLIMSGLILVYSLVLFVIVLNSEPDTSSNESTNMAAEHSSQRLQLADRRPLTPFLFTLVVGLELVSLTGPAIIALISFPRNGGGLGFWIVPLSAVFDFYIPVHPFLIVGHFVPQLTLLWRQQNDIRQIPPEFFGFAVDSVLYIAIGVSWNRLIAETAPFELKFWYVLIHWWTLEQLAAWMWFGYVLLGLGHAAVPISYLCLRWRTKRERSDGERADPTVASDETTPLLTHGER